MSESQLKLSAIRKQLEYWRAYGMKDDPFDDEIVDGRFFWGEEREELLRKALQLACCTTTAVVFYGPKGIGKTKLRQALEVSLEDDEQIVVVSLPAGHMTTPQQLLSHLGQAFDLQAEQLEPAEIEVRIKERLQANENTQNKLVILVDDADQLPEFTLASLLVMAHYPDNYISVLLFAATDSNGVLRAELQNQQIQQFEVTPFDAFTLESYLRYRLDLVGGDRNFPFTPADIDDLLSESDGIPSRVNELARQKLLAALQPGDGQSSRLKATRISLPALKIPYVNVSAIKVPNITLPTLSLPRIKIAWQPLAAVAGVVLFLGGAWLLSGGSADQPAKPVLASAAETSKTEAKNEPAAAVSAADQEWINQALSLSPAAGGPVADPAGMLVSTAVPPLAPPQTSYLSPAVSVAKESAEQAKKTAAAKQTEVKLASVKVKQKYIDQAKAALPKDEMYLLKSPKSSYTLQLLGSSSKAGMSGFVKDNKNIEILVFEEELQGRPWFVAVTGSFDSVEQARDGLSELPSALRDLKPWARQFSSVHADIRRHRGR